MRDDQEERLKKILAKKAEADQKADDARRAKEQAEEDAVQKKQAVKEDWVKKEFSMQAALEVINGGLRTGNMEVVWSHMATSPGIGGFELSLREIPHKDIATLIAFVYEGGDIETRYKIGVSTDSFKSVELQDMHPAGFTDLVLDFVEQMLRQQHPG